MTIIYRHEAPETDCYDTQHIVAERLQDGSTDITIIVGECGNPVAFMNHNLSIAESDKFGAVICKDIIDNYTGHAARIKDKITDLENAARDMRNSNNNLLNENTALQIARISSDDKRDEYRKKLVAERIDHMDEKLAINQTHDGIHRCNNSIIEELEARNKELEDEVGNLRVINAIHRKHGNVYREDIHKLRETHIADSATIEELRDGNAELKQCANLHNLCFAIDPARCDNIPIPVYGMRDKNFEMMTKGYHGMLSRHGKTIVITLPFEQEIVAINAVEYITGHDEHTDHNIKDAN